MSPTSLTVTQHQTATFYCSADGNPKPSVSWSKTSGTGQGAQGYELQIKSAGYNDSGSYVCTASNFFGQAKKVATLFVEGKHEIYLTTMNARELSAGNPDLATITRIEMFISVVCPL